MTVDPEPIVIPLQPRPTVTRVVHYRVEGRTATAIGREWRPGDSGPQGRCRLCRSCKASNDGCLIVIPQYVDQNQAALFSTVAMRDANEHAACVTS